MNRARPRLHADDRQWLTVSPYCVLATSDPSGRCTASGRGDPAGQLFHVLDDETIALAERPGNKRGDSLLNVLANPRIGVISLVPGSASVLLVNGRARVLRDAPFFDDIIVRGRRPILALLIEIEEVTYNCPKSLLRSGLWQPETWAAGGPPVARHLDQSGRGNPGNLGGAPSPLCPAELPQRL